MDNQKMYKCSEVMKTCEYCGYVRSSGMRFCDYIGVTGQRRGCDPEKCTRYKERESNTSRKRYRQTFDQIDIY